MPRSRQGKRAASAAGRWPRSGTEGELSERPASGILNVPPTHELPALADGAFDILHDMQHVERFRLQERAWRPAAG